MKNAYIEIMLKFLRGKILKNLIIHKTEKIHYVYDYL